MPPLAIVTQIVSVMDCHIDGHLLTIMVTQVSGYYHSRPHGTGSRKLAQGMHYFKRGKLNAKTELTCEERSAHRLHVSPDWSRLYY